MKPTQEQKNEWKHVAITYEITACRSGWKGVWDAVIAALNGTNRLISPRPFTVEVWIGLPPDKWQISSSEQLVKVNNRYINGVEVAE